MRLHRWSIAEPLERRILLSGPVPQLMVPAANTTVNSDRGYVDVAWNDPSGSGIRANTIDTKDLTINAVKPTSVTAVSAGVWRYSYTGTLPQGLNTVSFVAGQVKNNNNEANAAGSASFTLDSDGAYITNSIVPSAIYYGDNRFWIGFSESIDLSTFDPAADMTVSGPGGVVSNAIKDINWNGGSQYLNFTVTLPNVGGTYTLTVGPNIADSLGNLMNQDRDTTNGEATQDRYSTTFTLTPSQTIYQNNLDSDPGWSATPGSQWQFGHPTGGGGTQFGNPDPTSGHTGSNVYGVNLSGDYDTTPNQGFRYLTTGPIDVSNFKHVQLDFWQWLNTDHINEVIDTIDVGDGTFWTGVYNNSETPTTDNSWKNVVINISPQADRRPELYIRWSYLIQNGARPFSGWNIDDVSITGVPVDPSPAPSAPDLIMGSDTGRYSDDNVTKNDNFDANHRLVFLVNNTIAGATVQVYLGYYPIASATATGSSTIVSTTSGDARLGSGQSVLHATQTVNGKDASDWVTGPVLTIDDQLPIVTVNSLTTSDTTPAITGTVDQPETLISVTIDGTTYAAINNGNGTWTLPDNTITTPLSLGAHEVTVSAEDLAGNVGPDSTSNELLIAPPAPTISPEPSKTAGSTNTINWSAVNGADVYWAEYDSDPNFASPDGNSGWITGTSYTFTGLANGVTYYYRVKSAKLTPGFTSSWSQTSVDDFLSDSLSNSQTKTVPGAVALGRANLIMSDDFEDGDLNGWVDEQNAYLDQVTTSTAAAGKYSLDLWGNVGTYYRTLNNIQPARVDFSIRAADYGYQGYFDLEDSAGNRGIYFFMQTDHTMGLFVDNNHQYNTPYVTNTWYNVSLLLNWTSHTVDYYVNNQLIAANVVFREPATSFAYLRLSNYISQFNPEAWYDEIAISSSPTYDYLSAGSVTSTLITPNPFNSWTTLNFNANTPAGTSVTIDVLDAANNVLASNVPNGANLNSLGITAPSIKLRANLSTSNAALTPTLLDWNVGWKQNADFYLESSWSSAESSTQDAVGPTATITTPSPITRQTSPDTMTIVFNEAVTNFDLLDLQLTRDSGSNLLTANQTLTTSDNITWTLGNLSPIGIQAGTYSLSFVSGKTINDQVGNAMTSSVNPRGWLMNAVNGSGSGETIRLVRHALNSSVVDVFINNATSTPDYSVNIISLSNVGLQVLSQGGDDTIILDFAFGGLAAGPGLTVNGGDGNDTIQILGATTGQTFSFASTGFAFNPNPFAATAGALYSAVETLTYDGRGGGDTLGLSSGAVTLVGNQTFSSVAISGATVSLAAGAHVMRTGSLSVSAGKLDISDGAVIVDYSGSSPLTAIRNSILSGRGGAGFGNATWAGKGIMSTAAQIDPIAWSIGYAENSLLPLGAYSTWQGQSVDGTSILIKFTRGGDANLDGVVDDSDVTVLGATYNSNQFHDWYTGDFDYSGMTDDNDVTVLGALYDPLAPPV